MNLYKVIVSITDDEEELGNEFFIEANSFEEAVENLENALDISLQ